MSSSKRKPPIVYRSNVARAAQNNNNDDEKRNNFNDDDFDSFCSSDDGDAFVGLKSFKDHIGMGKRLKKTLYYGRHPKTERPSLPMSELAVEIFTQAVPDGLGRIDMHFAASVGRSACISPCSMILAMAYLERLRHRNPEYLQQQVSSSDLFLVSMLVASKFLYDEGEDEEVFNDEWAVSASMDVKDLNQLERNFLTAIDWNVCVNGTTFERLLRETERALALRKMDERGWSTYTEISVLSENVSFASYWKLLIDYAVKVIAVSALAYTASVLTMIGATIVANQVRTEMVAPPTSCSSLSSATAVVANVSNCTTETTATDLFFDGENESDEDRISFCTSSSCERLLPMLELRLDNIPSTPFTLTTTTYEDNDVPFWFSPLRSKLWPGPIESRDPSFERRTAGVTSLTDPISSPNSSLSRWPPRRWPSCTRKRIDEKTSCTAATSYSFSPFFVALS